MGRYQRFGQIRIVVILGDQVMGEIKIVLIDKTPVETLPLLVKSTVAIIRQHSVLKGLFHSTI